MQNEKLILYDQIWGLFAQLQVTDDFKLQLQVSNNFSDQIILYKIEIDYSIMFEYQISRDHGIISAGQWHNIDIQYIPQFDLNQINKKQYIKLIMIKTDSSHIYELTTTNMTSQELLQEFKGNIYNITFNPRQQPSLNRLLIQDMDFVQMNVDIRQQQIHGVDSLGMLQQVYICLQTRFKFLQEQNIKQQLLDDYTNQTLYIKVGISYFQFMSLQDRVELMRTARRAIQNNTFCLICFKKQDEFQETILCNVCGCFLGCSGRCALTFSALHHAECRHFEPFKYFENMSYEQIEASLQYREQESKTKQPLNYRVNVNEDEKDRWMADSYQLLQKAEKFLQSLEQPDSDKQTVQVTSSNQKQLTNEVQELVHVFNQTRDQRINQFNAQIDQDVQQLLLNITKTETADSYNLVVNRVKQIYNKQYEYMNVQAEGFQQINTLLQNEKQKLFEYLLFQQQRTIKEISLAEDYQLQKIEDEKLRENVQQLDLLLREKIKSNDVDQINVTVDKTLEFVQQIEKQVVQHDLQLSQDEGRKNQLKASVQSILSKFKIAQQEIQETLEKNKALKQIISVMENALVDQKMYSLQRKNQNIQLDQLENYKQQQKRLQNIMFQKFTNGINEEQTNQINNSEDNQMLNANLINQLESSMQQVPRNSYNSQYQDQFQQSNNNEQLTLIENTVVSSNQQNAQEVINCSDTQRNQQQATNSEISQNQLFTNSPQQQLIIISEEGQEKQLKTLTNNSEINQDKESNIKQIKTYSNFKNTLQNYQLMDENVMFNEVNQHIENISQISDNNMELTKNINEEQQSLEKSDDNDLFQQFEEQNNTSNPQQLFSQNLSNNLMKVKKYNSLKNIYKLIIKFTNMFNKLGQNYNQNTYIALIQQQVDLYNQVYLKLQNYLISVLKENDCQLWQKLDFAQVKFVELRLNPQKNLNFPIDLKIYLKNWFSVAYEYETLAESIERMLYYCIAKAPYVLNNTASICSQATGVFDTNVDAKILYQMLINANLK